MKRFFVFTLAMAMVFTLGNVGFASFSPDVQKESVQKSKKEADEDCGCDSTDPLSNPYEVKIGKSRKISSSQMGSVKDIFNAVKEKQYDESDFDWESGYLTNYEGSSTNWFIIPQKEQKDKEQRFLFVGHTEKDSKKEIGEMMIVKVEATPDEKLNVTYQTTNDTPIVGINEINPDTGMGKKVIYEEEASTNGDVLKCLQRCLKEKWKDAPEWLKVICGGACTTCILDPTRASCAACVTCLGTYALACTWKCRVG